MSYFLDLFSPETYEAFSRSDRGVSGFRQRHRGIAARVKPGDKLLCYMTKVMRWIGMLVVLDGPHAKKYGGQYFPCLIVVRFQRVVPSCPTTACGNWASSPISLTYPIRCWTSTKKMPRTPANISAVPDGRSDP